MKVAPWFDSYSGKPGHFDEFIDGQGRLRDAWSTIDKRLAGLPLDDLKKRDSLLQRLIVDNGVTYNIYSKPQDSRQWNMDLLPLVFWKQQWDVLEAQLTQRAELVNEILKDLYSRQYALQDAVLPSFLVYANPAFLRPCYGVEPVGGEFVNLYAADLSRSPDGNWWVMSDRIEAASGMGYVLENRSLSNRVFPEFFRDHTVTRIKPFYEASFDAMRNLHPHGSSAGRVALLTPGSANETYFEQSYLARNLGLQLVEGADLTVRDNQLFFKTLKGIHPVTTLIRRLDSDWCDPLELRNESLLGVPGMLNCVRSGKLALVNMLGSGLHETMAFPAFLNSLCRYYRQEELMLPSVATWWCGQPHEFRFVMENLERLVIKSTFNHRYERAVFAPSLNRDELNALRERMRAAPEHYCAQEIVPQTTAPVFINGQLQPHHFMMRVYMARIEGRFRLLPGGLARIAPTPDSTSVSMQHGAMSKDIWVIEQQRINEATEILHRSDIVGDLVPTHDDISSRTANNLYWFGRYIERTEGLVRLLRKLLLALTEDFHESTFNELRGFLALLISDSELEVFDSLPLEKRLQALDNILHQYVWSHDLPSSLISCFTNTQRIVEAIKERFSTDTWHILSQLRTTFALQGDEAPYLFHQSTLQMLEDALIWLAAFSGKTAENMVRGMGWHFLMMGRRIERTYALLELVSHSLIHNPRQEEKHLLHLLDYADSTITYRNRYLNHFHSRAVLQLILKDANNPRSLHYNVERIIHYLGCLPWKSSHSDLHDATGQKISTNMLEHFSRLDPRVLDSESVENAFAGLRETLDSLHLNMELRFFSQV